MGVDYQVWVIPKQRTFRPNAEQVANLANALRSGRWVPQPHALGQHSHFSELLQGGEPFGRKPQLSQEFGAEPFTASWVEFHSKHELLLEWHVKNLDEAQVEYPFVFDPFPDSGPPYFTLQVVVGDDLFHWIGENVMAFDPASTNCACGEHLEYLTGWVSGLGAERIRRSCLKCGRHFDPSTTWCDTIDGWSGERTPLAGGLTFRFALKLDCHKYWPREEEAGRRFQLRPEFLEIWRKCIGRPFEIVVTFD